MPAATFTFFDEWVRYEGTVANVETDTFKLLLTNTAVNAATNTVKADLTPISGAGGYAEKTPTVTWAETGAGTGVWRFSLDADQTWTASGAAFDQFQYVVLYDDTTTAPVDALVGYWDYGSALNLADGDSLTLDLDANLAVYTKQEV